MVTESNGNGPRHHSFPDDARTSRSHAGESIEDGRNWPGLVLIGVGIALLAIALTAAGYGFEGWAVVTGVACAICSVLGGLLVAVEHRRIKTAEGISLREPRGH